jgi:hypothetical protein
MFSIILNKGYLGWEIQESQEFLEKKSFVGRDL